jgi:hypothetical protein
MTLALVSASDGSGIHLQVSDSPSPPESHKPVLEHLIIDLLRRTSPLSRKDIRAQLRVNNQRLGHALAKLEKRGQILRSADGWYPTTSLLCEDLPCSEKSEAD